MARKAPNMTCGPPKSMDCCRVEAIVSVDERGQMVLPKEIREKAGIRADDKLAIVGWEREGRLCCIAMIKVNELSEIVRSFLGPIVKGVFQE